MSTPTQKKLAELFFDRTVRIEKIIWLASNPEAGNDDLTDFLQDQYEEAKRFFGSEPPEDTDDHDSYLADLFNDGFTGYLVKMATPKRDEDTGFFSWGYYQTEWFYFPQWDEEEIGRKAEAFADRVRPARA